MENLSDPFAGSCPACPGAYLFLWKFSTAGSGWKAGTEIVHKNRMMNSCTVPKMFFLSRTVICPVKMTELIKNAYASRL